MSTGEIATTETIGNLQDAESAIRAIWIDVLGEDAPPELGPDDNFFELGGTSLALVDVITKMGERFHADLPTDIVAKGATIRALAQSSLDWIAESKSA